MPPKPRRSYSTATIAALTTLARGGCYYPGYGVPIIKVIEGEPILNLEIAHIRAFEDKGPRAEVSLDPRERNTFANLLLFCTPHHKLVDGPRREEFPVRTLESWKKARESDGVEALAGLTNLTENKLAAMIQEAQRELLERVEPALQEFSEQFPELAQMLRSLTRELSDPRVHGFGISPDSITLLGRASSDLAHLPDSVRLLYRVAQPLRTLPDSVKLLRRAAEELSTAVAKAEDAARRMR